MKTIIKLINFYQKYISANLPPKCKYFPSCSEYAKQSIKGYGLILGGFLLAWRLLRCNPAAKGGFDYLPQSLKLFGWRLYKK
ncbi:MAG: membrane protein insertion efficiency factor YidD [Bifidobacteriaceae bacterium]|jgi:putative membrane protein insertion efficiency factor|nr:membrane protein insertion efficiency factor YidD [Bifidobacteriaceae bacterium]